jgi:hypothetical protein
VAGRTASDPLTDRLLASPVSTGELLITTQGLKTSVFNICCIPTWECSDVGKALSSEAE